METNPFFLLFLPQNLFLTVGTNSRETTAQLILNFQWLYKPLLKFILCKFHSINTWSLLKQAESFHGHHFN